MIVKHTELRFASVSFRPGFCPLHRVQMMQGTASVHPDSHVPAVGAFECVIAGLITIDNDLGAYLQGLLGHAAAEQGIGTSALDHPDIFRAVGIRYFHVDPGMRIDPLNLDDFAL